MDRNVDKIKLFCLPYAGGSGMVYLKWKRKLQPGIELCPVEMPGRGRRFNEPLLTRVEEMVDSIYVNICEQIEDSRYAVFGHSMGSLLAFELFYKLKQSGYRSPVHMFFSGRCSPQTKKQYDKVVYQLPDEEFKKEIMKLGGTPKVFFENKVLLDTYMPVLRSDYEAIETYTYVEHREKIDTDITVLKGHSDVVTSGIVDDWESLADGSCSVRHFEGGHFFIHSNEDNVIRLINQTLHRDGQRRKTDITAQSYC